MKKINGFVVKNSNNHIVLDFGKSCNLIKLSFKCRENTKIMYVQNAVIDSPISIGETITVKQGIQELLLARAVPATHIYIYTNESISDIKVFEDEDTNILNLYPKCIDQPLKENYYLDTVSVFTGAEGFSHYSLYTSLNGSDFELVCVKNNDKPCGENGDIYNLNGREARVIRVYYEYNSVSPESAFKKIEYTGRPSGNPTTERHMINVCDFKDSEYNIKVTDEDAVKEVYGIVTRRLGEKYKTWFDFSIGEGKKYDYYKISNKNGKVGIIGNIGVSLAAGLNYYLKYYCKVNISQVGDQVKMPNKPIMPEKDIYRETKARIRYAYNYCTLSYTNAFWGEREWRNELDWLALNGVNVVLDITAQEEVWRRFLGKIGYAVDEVKAFLTGPAYYAWQYMANEFEFGGPVPDSWFEKCTRLARHNQLIMRKLGMQTVLQGYSGMVPVNIKNYDSEIEIIPQGRWCSIQRPAMIKTDCPSFKKYAKLFYESQREVLGDAVYFATDPFHEGGITGGMSPRTISKNVLSEMLRANPDSVWVIQSWQANPTSELLAGIKEVENGTEHTVVLDLYAEKLPNYSDGKPGNPNHGYAPEFDGTPWVYCMLNNFGGRLGLHGHLDNMVSAIPKILNRCKYFVGIGMTCEASENNPVLYDFLFESVWQEDAEAKVIPANITEWLHSYSERRYGAESRTAYMAWDILEDTVYKAKHNMIGQGAPESMVNARPQFNLKKASMWGNSIIGYDPKKFEKAAELILEDYDKMYESSGYIYDLVSVFEQLLSNRALDAYNSMSDAYNRRCAKDFKAFSSIFLKIADDMERLTANCEYYRLSRFMNFVHSLAEDGDDFTKRIFIMNGKSLLTVLGYYPMSEKSREHDYSNRQWSGLIGGFYKKRWQRYIDEVLKELNGKQFNKDINWYEWEWQWARDETDYDELDYMSKCDFHEFLVDLLKERKL